MRTWAVILFLVSFKLAATESPLYVYTFYHHPVATLSTPIHLGEGYRLLDPPAGEVGQTLRQAETSLAEHALFRLTPGALRLPTTYTLRLDRFKAHGEVASRTLSSTLEDLLPGTPLAVEAVRVIIVEDGVRRGSVVLQPAARILTELEITLGPNLLLQGNLSRKWRMEIGDDLRGRGIDLGLSAKRVLVRVDLETPDELIPALHLEYDAQRFRREYFLGEIRYAHPDYLYHLCAEGLRRLRRR